MVPEVCEAEQETAERKRQEHEKAEFFRLPQKVMCVKEGLSELPPRQTPTVAV